MTGPPLMRWQLRQWHQTLSLGAWHRTSKRTAPQWQPPPSVPGRRATSASDGTLRSSSGAACPARAEVEAEVNHPIERGAAGGLPGCGCRLLAGLQCFRARMLGPAAG